MTILDYSIVVVYLLATLGLGIWLARRNRNEEEYLLGGGRLSPKTLGLSLFATFISTITYLAIPGEMIKSGPMYLAELLAFPLIFLVAGYVIIPRIARQPVTSAYEILDRRLGSATRWTAEALFLLSRFAWMALILETTSSKVLAPLLGIPAAWSPALSAGLGLVTIVYTSWGGFRAVVYTDVIQALILFCGAVLCVILISAQTGGLLEWWPKEKPETWQQLIWVNGPGGSRAVLALILFNLTWFAASSGSDQVTIQRYLATRDPAAARRTLGISLVAQVLALCLLATIGLGILRYYTLFPDRLPADAAGQPLSPTSSADKLFPAFIANQLPVGISGVVLAALLAAAMSSLSSGVSATGAVLTVRFLPQKSEREHDSARTAQVIALLVGLIAMGFSLFIHYVPGNLIEQTSRTLNVPVSPLFGLFLMALFVPRASAPATLIGCGLGLATSVLISYWDVIFAEKCPLSLFYAMPVALAVQMAVSVALSWTILPGRANVAETAGDAAN